VKSPVVDIDPARRLYATTTGGGVANAANSPEPGVSGEALHAERELGSLPDRLRILLLAANPMRTDRLAIDEEARAISRKMSRNRDVYELVTRWAVRPADLIDHLDEFRPHIVHFSGHGSPSGEILLAAGDGTARPVGIAALAEIFRVMRDDVRVVLLNACYTVAQAQAISQHVDFVIGTRAPITDEAATVFAAAFYSALGFGRNVPQAFDRARAALMVHGLPGKDIPQLIVRPGADLHVLSPDRPADRDAPARGAAVNPNPTPGQPQPHVTASGQSAVVQGHGNVVNTGNTTVNPLPPPARKRWSVDTKVLLGALVLDVAFFLYGMQSYTGRNTNGDTWRAVIFLVLIGTTAGMIRRWFRRRT
jgi:CHAT domain